MGVALRSTVTLILHTLPIAKAYLESAAAATLHLSPGLHLRDTNATAATTTTTTFCPPITHTDTQPNESTEMQLHKHTATARPSSASAASMLPHRPTCAPPRPCSAQPARRSGGGGGGSGGREEEHNGTSNTWSQWTGNKEQRDRHPVVPGLLALEFLMHFVKMHRVEPICSLGLLKVVAGLLDSSHAKLAQRAHSCLVALLHHEGTLQHLIYDSAQTGDRIIIDKLLSCVLRHVTQTHMGVAAKAKHLETFTLVLVKLASEWALQAHLLAAACTQLHHSFAAISDKNRAGAISRNASGTHARIRMGAPLCELVLEALSLLSTPSLVRGPSQGGGDGKRSIHVFKHHFR